MKEEIIERLMSSLVIGFTVEQANYIKEQLNLILYDYNIVKQERSLSTEVGDEDKILVQKFIMAKTLKGCSERTIKYYMLVLRNFQKRLQKHLKEITAEDFRYYFALRNKDGVSKVTQDNELRSLRSFYDFLDSEEIIEKNPTKKITKIKTGKRQKEAFTDMEVEKIRQTLVNKPYSTNFNKLIKLQQIAIFESLLSSGCRVGELVNIKISDIDNDKINVIGKGNKERTVYLNAKSKLAIENLIQERKDNNPYLFIDARNPSNDKPIGINGVESFIRKLGHEVGIEKCHPHKFRRTAATNAMRKGMPIELISKMLGHSNIGTTQIYLQINDDELYQSHKKYM